MARRNSRSAQEEALDDSLGQDYTPDTSQDDSPYATPTGITRAPVDRAPSTEPVNQPFASAVSGAQAPQSQGGLAANPNTGTMGGAPMGVVSPAQQPQYQNPGLGQYASSMQGFDSGKLNSDHSTPKYQFARVASNFDPSQGITPDMLGQLNGLGIGQFSGQGDKLHIANGSPEFNGISDFDVNQGFKTGQGQWAWQPEGQMSGAGGAGAVTAQPSTMPQGSSDPSAMLAQLSQQASQGDSYSAQVLQYLMQQLGLGQALGQPGQ